MFPDHLQVFAVGYRVKSNAKKYNPVATALAPSTLLQSPVVCVKDANLPANTTRQAAVKRQTERSPEICCLQCYATAFTLKTNTLCFWLKSHY